MKNILISKSNLPAFSFVAVLLALAIPASGQKPDIRAIDPKAEALLKESAATYTAIRSYSCQIETELKMDSVPGSRIIKLKMTFQKPDKAAVSMTKYDETTQFFTDGKSLYIYAPKEKEYAQENLPLNVPPIAPILTQGETFIGLVLMKPTGLSDLADPVRTKSLTLGPPETLEGIAVRTITRVTSGKGGGQMTFFVTIGTKDHLIHKFADTIQSPKPLPIEGSNVKQIDSRETYTNIQFDTLLPASTFLPPLDAKKAEPSKTDITKPETK